MLLLVWLFCHSSYAQKTSTPITKDSESITKTGISLPQLITTDINRSKLQFGVNLSEGLKQPNLSASFKKFISNKNKQFTFNGGLVLSHTFAFEENDFQEFYNINSVSINLGADLKFFNEKNYFIQIGTQNWIHKSGGLIDIDHFNFSNSLTLGIGKGRIEYVNDGVAAMTIVEKLAKYGIINRSLTEFEYSIFIQKINELKNRRKFVNRSYPLTETEEIQDLLSSFGIVSADIDITPILNEAYKYEPMIDRTTGSQFRIAVTAANFHTNLYSDFNSLGLVTSLSYMVHSPISTKWQYNKGITGYITAAQSNFDDLLYIDNNLKKAGISLTNDFYYLIDNRMRLSLLTTTGYNFIHKINSFDPFDNTYIENKGFYLDVKSEFEYQISRTMSTTFGIDLRLTPKNTSTGLHLGLKF